MLNYLNTIATKQAVSVMGPANATKNRYNQIVTCVREQSTVLYDFLSIPSNDIVIKRQKKNYMSMAPVFASIFIRRD